MLDIMHRTQMNDVDGAEKQFLNRIERKKEETETNERAI